MDRRLITRLVETSEAQAAGARLIDVTRDVPHCDLALTTDHGFAFFRIIKPKDDVVERWLETQDEIADFLAYLSKQVPYPNAYLTLLVEDPSDQVRLQRIERNSLVCRKLVVPMSGEVTEADLIRRLPFFGLPEMFQQAMRLPFPDPIQAVQGTHLSANFVTELLENKTADRELAENLGQFLQPKITGQWPTTLTAPNRAAGHSQRLRIDSLKPTWFRNFGSTDPIRFLGDLIIIYGRNGTGKTSIVEALEWALTGESSRVAVDQTQVKVNHRVLANKNRGDSQTQVELTLSGLGDNKVVIRRQLDVINGKSRVWMDRTGQKGSRVSNDQAVLRQLVPTAGDGNSSHVPSLRPPFQTLHFLAQHTMEGFLSQTSRQYDAVSRMAGTEQFGALLDKGTRVLSELGRLIRRSNEELEKTQRNLGAIEAEYAKIKAALIERRKKAGTGATFANVGLRIATLADHHGWKAESLTEAGTSTNRRSVLQALVHVLPSRRIELNELETRLGQLKNSIPDLIERYKRQTALSASIRHGEQARQRLQDETETLIGQLSTLARQIGTIEADIVAARRRQECRLRLAELDSQGQALHDARERAEATLKVSAVQAEASTRRTQEVGQGLAELEGSLEKSRLLVGSLERRTARLVAALEQWPDWTSSRQELSAIDLEVSELNGRLQVNAEVRSTVGRKLDATVAQMATMEAELAESLRLDDQRRELVAQLRLHVHEQDEVCPLCGWHWGNEQLKNSIDQMSRTLPSALIAAQNASEVVRHLVADLRKDQAELKAAADQLELRRTSLKNRHQELIARLDQADREVNDLCGKPLQRVTQEQLQLDCERTVTAQNSARAHQERLDQSISNSRAEMARLSEAVRQAKVTVLGLDQDIAQLGNQMDSLTAERESLRQSFDSDHTASMDEETLQIDRLTSDLSRNKQDFSHLQGQELTLRSRLDQAIQTLVAYTQEQQGVVSAIASVERDMESVGVASTSREEVLTVRITERRGENAAALRSLDQLEQEVQRGLVYLEVEEISERMQKADLQREDALAQVVQLNGEVQSLTERSAQVEDLLAHARTIRQEYQESYVRAFSPMIDVLYQRLNQHPYFGELDIKPRDGELHIQFAPQKGSTEREPVLAYFSQAQRVSVALSIFLSSALLQGWTQLGTVCIDDPVQHLDDMNVYAFLDLLQGIVLEGRQMIVTTASEELYKTFLTRFRSWNQEGKHRFQAFRLEGVTPTGPQITDDTGLT